MKGEKETLILEKIKTSIVQVIVRDYWRANVIAKF